MGRLTADPSKRPLRKAKVKDAGSAAKRAYRAVREREARLRTPRLAFLCGLLLCTTAASAAVVQQGNLRVTLLSQVQPYKLPRIGTSPISVFVAGRIAAAHGGVPDQLQRLQIKVNRHARFQSRGLPVCPLSAIQPATTQRALAACGPALVGSGQFWAHIVLPEQGAYPTQGRLLVFNGRTSCIASRNSSAAGLNSQRHARTRREPSEQASLSDSFAQRVRRSFGSGGHAAIIQNPPFPNRLSQSDSFWRLGKGPADHVQESQRGRPCHPHQVLLAQIFTANPFATSFVIAFRIRHLRSGTYGTQFSASLPAALGSWGYVDRIKLTLKRKYRYQGRRLSYFNAGCPAIRGTDRTSYHLADALFAFATTKIDLRVDKACGVKP